MSTRETLASEVCDVVDGAVADRLIVFGSLPPEGGDLDLLVRAAEERAVRAALRAAGLAERGRELVAFRPGAAYRVELEPAGELSLPQTELDELFSESVPLAGRRHICRPAPHHVLLVLATVVLGGSGELSPKRHARVRAALAEDPSAWTLAAQRAPAWGGERALARLRESFERDPAAPPGRRRAAQRLVRRPRRGAVIALSGIDGAGKSSQAESLQAVLSDLGWDAGIEWNPIAQNRSLDWFALPVKRTLALLAAVRRAPAGATGEAAEHGAALRGSSPLVNYLWATVVALTNGLTHARHCAPPLFAGRVVIFDRYVLDSVVRLRFLYGADHRFGLQRRLIRALSPRPACAFFLDIAADTSLSRKQDRWRAEELRTQAELYRSEYARHAVVRLDGERSPDALAAEIAEAVWRRLR